MQPSPYRGHPTPEIEEAWVRLWRGKLVDVTFLYPVTNLVSIANVGSVPMIGFPETKMIDLNKTSPKSYAHVSERYGDSMLGFLNVFHQLHCLVRTTDSPLSLVRTSKSLGVSSNCPRTLSDSTPTATITTTAT